MTEDFGEVCVRIYNLEFRIGGASHHPTSYGQADINALISSVAENENRQCHPCESRGSERKSWIPAFAGMTNTVSATGNN